MVNLENILRIYRDSAIDEDFLKISDDLTRRKIEQEAGSIEAERKHNRVRGKIKRRAVQIRLSLAEYYNNLGIDEEVAFQLSKAGRSAKFLDWALQSEMQSASADVFLELAERARTFEEERKFKRQACFDLICVCETEYRVGRIREAQEHFDYFLKIAIEVGLKENHLEETLIRIRTYNPSGVQEYWNNINKNKTKTFK